MTSTANKIEIMELIARYSHAIDGRDAEGFAGCFTEDGELLFNGKVHAHGRDGFLAMIRNAPDRRYRHFTSNIVIEGDDETAKVKCYVMAFRAEEELGPPYIIAQYSDVVVRVGESWLLKRREAIPLAGKSMVIRS